jgi:hypothetical protein
MRAKQNAPADLLTVDGNRRTGIESHGLAPGFEIRNDERHLGVKNFHIPDHKRNISSTIDNSGDELKCISCKKTHEIDFSVPLCLVLTDQNFPPSLPAIDGQCCVILRVEDGLLFEFPGLLKEYFGDNLPGGSVVLFGSLSHLAALGLDSYAEDVVRTQKVISKMVDKSCSVTHAVPVPLGGVGRGP